jgi:hypothetical protein
MEIKNYHTPILAYLIGALADGSLYHNPKQYVKRVTYYQHSKQYLLDCIEPRVEELFGIKGHFYYDKRKDVHFYEITIKQVYQVFAASIEDFKSKNDRKVPRWIMQSETAIQYAFVCGFFDADGFFLLDPKKHDYRVRFGQAEFHILKDIKAILSDEFQCSEVYGPYQSKEGVKPYFELHLYGIDQVHKFHQLIRPCHPEKQVNSLLSKEHQPE